MAKKTKKVRKATKVVDVKRAQANDKPEAATKSVNAVPSVRSLASQRTAAGKFNRQVFAKIGGKEAPNYAKLTWVR